MAPMILTPVFILILTISLTGCALSPIKKGLNQTGTFDPVNQETIEDLILGDLLNYQQQVYQLEDPSGDHALITLLQLTAPDVVWLTISGKGYSELLDDVNEWRSGFAYEPIGLDRFRGLTEQKPKFSNSGYRKTWSKNQDVFTDVITQEEKNGIKPTTGVCHRWSSEYRDNPKTSTFPYMFFSKLFWTLAYGESSVYLVTEKEEQLAQWVINQKIRSVSLELVFRKSYQLNSGDVYLSILTATNVFSRFWYINDRESLSIATRLKLITAKQNGEEDNFGAWHHFWGMVLFGYCHGKTSSKFVGWIESIGSHMVTEHDEAAEDYINRHAGQVGVNLRERIENWPLDLMNELE
jgi:hypothetical protein